MLIVMQNMYSNGRERVNCAAESEVAFLHVPTIHQSLLLCWDAHR